MTVLDLTNLQGFTYQLEAGDIVNLVVYQGTKIYQLPAADFTVNTSASTITVNLGADLTGVTEIAVSIATRAYHAAGEPIYYYGFEPLQVGQPVVSSGSLVIGSNGQVELYTPATIGNNATQIFDYDGGTTNTETFTLKAVPDGYIDVTIPGTDLPSGAINLVGNQVTVSPSFMPAQDSQVVITYRLSLLDHQSGEPVYVQTKGATQNFDYASTTNTETFTLSAAPDGSVAVTIAGNVVPSSEIQVSGDQVTVLLLSAPKQGSQVVINYLASSRRWRLGAGDLFRRRA